MPGFADCFWSGDYAGGLGVLFGKLQQGVVENTQVLTIARMRAEAEYQYGAKLGDIVPTTDKMTGGFARDDGASLRKVCPLIRSVQVDPPLRDNDRRTKAFVVKCKKLPRTTRKLRQT